MNVIQHFVDFALMHPANAGILIVVGLLILWLFGLVKLSL